MLQAVVTLASAPAGSGCPGLDALNPVCQLTSGIGSSIVGSGLSAIFSAFADWVVSGATWLLDQIGSVLNATTSVDVSAQWFTSHYGVMTGLLGVVVLPLLLMATIQSIYRQSASTLLRSLFVHLPLAMLLAGVGVQLVQMGLTITDALSSTVSAGSGQDIHSAISSVASALASSAGTAGVPAFVLVLGALVVAFGAFLLWIELLVRAAAVYVAVLFLPLVLATLVWPALSHWCRRLVDTLVALILSKFVIVAVLSLAAGALTSPSTGQASGGSEIASVLAGGALFLLAACTPFTLLRLVPLAESGAAQQLEGARHRVQSALGAPRSALQLALAQSTGTLDMGSAGTGLPDAYEPPGPERGAPDPQSGGGAGSHDIPMWEGTPHAEDSVRQWLEAGAPPRGSKGIKPVIGVAPGPGRGEHVIAHDDMGPVIKWIPPGDEGGEP
jgi:type IV secretion system protein TrbL